MMFYFIFLNNTYAQNEDVKVDDTVTATDEDWGDLEKDIKKEATLEEEAKATTTPQNTEEQPPNAAASATNPTTESDSDNKTKEELDSFDWASDDENSNEKNANTTNTETTPEKMPEIIDPSGNSNNGETQVAEGSEAKEEVFEIGPEEEELIKVSQILATQMSDEEWKGVMSQKTQETTYTVQKDDWLFKISKRLFGSGFYYPKIWSMNPYITNPHEIEVGMTLVFDPGSAVMPPNLSFQTADGGQVGSSLVGTQKWFAEKKALIDKGVFINSSPEDIAKIMGNELLNEEYKKYIPPEMESPPPPPQSEYDKSGIDRSSQNLANFKNSFYLNTFITTNELKTFGVIESKIDAGFWFREGDVVFVVADEAEPLKPGEIYSYYIDGGKMDSDYSDREGQKFTIAGTVKILQKREDKWEAQITEVLVQAERGTKLTAYTPKIESITPSFNSRKIEGTLFAGYDKDSRYFSAGNVVYIDRGRADGLEIGNVLDVYDNVDRGTGKVIMVSPTYKNAELTVISMTDNFATARVTKATRDVKVGDLVVTRSGDEQMQELANTRRKLLPVQKEFRVEDYKAKGLGEELNDKIKNTKLSDEELAELERQRAQRDILDGTEKDLRALDDLEKDVNEVDAIASKVNADPLEKTDLEDFEGDKNKKELGVDLDKVEEKVGKKYIDESLQTVENPYGLTPFDVEEVDELLSSQSALKKSKSQKLESDSATSLDQVENSKASDKDEDEEWEEE